MAPETSNQGDEKANAAAAASMDDTDDNGHSNTTQRQIDEQVQAFLSGTPAPHSAGAFDVRFRELNVIGAGLGAQRAPTVANTALRHLQSINPVSYLSSQPVATRTLLHSFTGTVRGGEMLLVLGKPGSGCTTFLKTVANMWQEYHAIEGEVLIGSDDAPRMKKDFPGEFGFSSEDDIHFASLSVETTLRFSVNARISKSTPDRSKLVNRTLDSLIDLFGLSHVKKTRVGDDYKRGVSGGQRHRVTVAEAVSTRAGVMCLDNPTRGLDSSTALKLMQTMRSYTNQRGAATVMSVYQASDAMAELFDKVLVINNGRQIYFGPMAEAKDYFKSLGFYCDPRTSLTDFLTTMSGDRRSRTVREGFSGPPPPTTPEEFEAVFKRSRYWTALTDETSTAPQAPRRSGKVGYALPFWQQVYQCSMRQHRVQLTDRGPWIAEAAGLIVQALMLGTLYWNQQAATRGLYTRAAALFFTVLVMVLQASAEFGNTFAQRPILLRHEAMMLYRPASYALGQILADMPWKVAIILYNLPVYFLANFQRDAAKFFTWFFVLYCAIMSLGVMFRTIAVFTVSPTRAILPVGLLMNVFIIYTGFYVTPPGMKVWLGWIRYLNPMYYSFEGVMVNEIAGSQYRCSQPDTVPVGASYNDSRYQTCAVQGFEPGAPFLEGEAYLNAFYGFQSGHLWRNVGIMLGFFLAFSVAVMIGMEQFKMPAGKLATVFFSGEVEAPRPPRDVESQHSGSSYGEKPGEDDDKQDGESRANISGASPSQHAEIVRTEKTFAWKDICIDVETPDGTKRLLDNVSGYLPPGSMTALMGMSGAGKTTLLNAISQRAKIGVLTGSMFLDASPIPRSFKRRTGFVHQQDVHLSTSTVREALRLVAYLRQPASTPRAAKDAYVDAIIDLLEMRDIADAVIGAPGAGLSLERRKRVSIGVELAAKPDVLVFFDEPTSGLDGDSALLVVGLMRKLADAGLTVLCTIHQPAARLMRDFDGLLLLMPGGRTAYFGELGEDCGSVVEYFERHTRRCRARENPADYFLAESVNADVDWHRLWLESDECERLRLKLEGNGDGDDGSSSGGGDEEPDRYAGTAWEQLRVVTRRAFTDYWRDPDYVLGKFQLNLWMGLINSLTYLQLGGSMTDMRSKMFSIFVGVITGPVIALAVEPRFTRLRDQFLAREKDSNTYRWVVFVGASVAVELPWAMITGFVYWCLWHYAVGFPYGAGRAGYAFLLYQLYTLFITGVAQMTAACFPTVQGAQMATGFVFLIINTFNGPLSPPPLTPRGWRWIYNVSPLFYFVDAMASNAVHGQAVVCKPEETSVFFTPPDGPSSCSEYAADYFGASNSTGYLLDPSATGRCEYCPFLDGDQYIRQYEFSYSHRADNVGIFIGFILFNFTIVFAVTWLFFIRKRKA